MIGKGAQYLTAAGFGRYRITAASLGNLDLLGTLGWLRDATKQAIMDAFLDDGMAVINATNAYLNQLAVSDRDKATALAGFINEDPMMVCSLGLQPDLTVLPAMPRRFLVGADGASITTDVNMGTPFDFEMLCGIGNAGWPFDVDGDYQAYMYGIARGGAGYWVCGLFAGGLYVTSVSADSQIHTLRHENGTYKVDNTTLTNSAFISNNTRHLRLAKQNTIMAFARLTDPSTGNQMHYFAPCIHNGQSGIYDIDAKIWKGNSESTGSYSMAFKYYYNGSWVTWTPTTP